MTHDVFVCHSSKDRMIANAIVARLEEHGIRCWIAPRDVVPGLEYAESIVEALARSTLTVLVFSANANSSPHVRRELERTASHGIPILPFRVEDVVPAPSVEYFISDAHWLDAMTPPMEQHLDHLVGTVRLLLDRQAAAAGVPAAWTTTAEPVTALTPAVPGPPAAPTSSRPRWVPPALVAAAVIVVAVVAGVMVALDGGDPAAAPDSAASAVSTTLPDESTPGSDQGDAGEMELASTFLDGFDVSLRQGWSWENEDPSGWRVVDGWLEIDAAPSPPMLNVLLRPVPDAPTTVLSTQLRFAPDANYQFAGIVLTGDEPERDRIQFGRAFCDEEACVGDGLYLDVSEGGSLVGTGDRVPLAGVESIFLALEIQGGMVTATYSFDGGDDWYVVGTVPGDGSFTRIGLVAHQAPTPVTAAFEYVVLAEYR
jgi:hypothetical protein